MASVTRKTRTNRADRRELVRRELLGAVERLLEGGESYTELSVERLVEAADISRSTFYVYFEDKGELLRALTEDVIVAMIEAGRGWWGLPPRASKDEVRAALRNVFFTYREHRALFAAVVEVAAYDAGVRAQFGAMMERVIEELATHIRDGQAQGSVHGDLDPGRTAAWLTWMAERGLYQLVRPASEAEVEPLLTAITDVVWNTLYQGTR